MRQWLFVLRIGSQNNYGPQLQTYWLVRQYLMCQEWLIGQLRCRLH